jgi:hypothetical protein
MIDVTTATGMMLVLTLPANAEVFRIANKEDSRQSMIVDCPQSPESRDLAWVGSHCTKPPAAQAAQAKNVDPIMIIGWSHEVQSPRDAN